MPVTELARLHLKNGKSLDAPENESARAGLLSAIKAQAAYAAYPVYLFTEVEDPSYVYILGGWDSVEAHMEKWIPSETNQQALSSLQEDVEVAWLQHIDIDLISHGSTTGSDASGESGIPLSATVIAIGRYFVPDAKRGGFQDTFSAHKHHLEAYTAPRSLAGDWRLDAEIRKYTVSNDKEEFVLFSGWNAVEDHFKFAESDGFKDFAKIKEFLEGAEIKHVVRWAAS